MKARDSSLWSAAHPELSSQYDRFLHDPSPPCKDLDRSMQPSLRPSVRTPRRSSATCQKATDLYSLQKLWWLHRRDQVGNGKQKCTQTHEREPTPISHTYFAASIASMEPIEKGQPSCPEAGLEPPADGKCRQCSGRWQCPETEQESSSDQPSSRHRPDCKTS